MPEVEDKPPQITLFGADGRTPKQKERDEITDEINSLQQSINDWEEEMYDLQNEIDKAEEKIVGLRSQVEQMDVERAAPIEV